MRFLAFGLLFCLQAAAHDEFKNLRVVCFGCSTGIGRATAEILLKGGAHVVISYRSPSKAKDLLDQFPSTAKGIAADAGEPAQIAALAKDAKKFFGRTVTSLIFAPTAMSMGTFRATPVKQVVDSINDQISINVNALAYFVDAFKDDLIAASKISRNLGSIVAVGTVVANPPIFGTVAYSVAKAAQDTLVRSLALEFGALGVRVNSVLPAVIRTPILDAALGEEGANAFYKDASWRHMLGRYGTPDECGHMMAFLVSDKASFITGQQIRVDGGQSGLGSLTDIFSGMLTPPDDEWFPISKKWSAPEGKGKKEL